MRSSLPRDRTLDQADFFFSAAFFTGANFSGAEAFEAFDALAALLAILQAGVGFCLGPRAARAADPPAAPPLSLDRGDFEQGLEVALVVSHELGLEEEEAALDRIYDIGSRIALAADDPSTVTSFYVVKMAEPNAFAVPGGFIFYASDDEFDELDGRIFTRARAIEQQLAKIARRPKRHGPIAWQSPRPGHRSRRQEMIQ